MKVLQGLEPAEVFRYFEEICRIPHTSCHEKALSDYCVEFARKRGLFCTQDELGNVLIVAEATAGYEEQDTVILQGHLDMVGDKLSGFAFDFEKDSIRLQVKDGYIMAEGTTLGGDDGIAVAYALAVLDAEDIPHPRLEVVLTVQEEIGLVGASAMDLSMCRGRKLINIDSEIEGILTAGCAGGRRACCRIPVSRTEMAGVSCTLELTGLLGGHSGTEIDKGRANAAELLGRFLLLLEENADYGLLSMEAGAKENVIPKTGTARLLVPESGLSGLRAAAAAFGRHMDAEYGTADPEIRLELRENGPEKGRVLSRESLDRALGALNLMPCGIQAMSMDLPGLVETSINLGVMTLEEETLTLRFSMRSSVQSAKEQLARKVEKLTRLLGGTAEFQGDYPAWPYARQSALREACMEIYKEQYGEYPKVQALHAGLECGILSGKIEGLDCISFGPNQLDIHTASERLEIASVERVWNYLKAVLAAKV